MPRDPYRDAIAAEARSGCKRPPDVLPFAFRGLIPLGPDRDGWPKALGMPDGMGVLVVRWWDELYEATNYARPESKRRAVVS